MSDVTRAEYCAVAIADCFADDGEIMGSPMGLLPSLGARLAKLTSNPLLMITDGEARILQGAPPLGVTEDVVEGWMPFRLVLESVVPYGKRHVMMGATQIDREGNQNISAIGDVGAAEAPAARRAGRPRQHGQQQDLLLGAEALARGSSSSRSTSSPASAAPAPRRPARRRPGSTACTAWSATSASSTSAVPATRCGSSRCTPASPSRTCRRRRRSRSTADGDVPETREPSPGELMLIREMLDPKTLRDREVPPVEARAQ